MVSLGGIMTDLNKYEMFVNSKLAKPSTDFDAMIESLRAMKESGDGIGVRVPELITAAEGLAAEGGEFIEIVKKMQWQGKPLDLANKLHLQKELGDILFYAMVACTALGITADEAIEMNTDKVSGRYKEGFTVEESENRVEGDL